MASAFPKGRVIRRAYLHATGHLTSWGGGVALAVLFALAGAVIPTPLSPTWVGRFPSLLIAALAVLGVALCSAVGWNMWLYRRSKHEDDNWYVDAACIEGLGTFRLIRRHDETGVQFTEHGILECVVDTPRGVVTIPDERPEMWGTGDSMVSARWDDCGPGGYEVRWYGSRGKGRGFYEITRGTFRFPDVSDEARP